MDYAKYAKLNDSDKARVDEINLQIAELERERAKIFRNKTTIFDDEKDYLASKISDFYVNGTNKMHRCVRINPKYSVLWSGFRQVAEHRVFGITKLPDSATDEQINRVKKEIIKLIDDFDRTVIQTGELW